MKIYEVFYIDYNYIFHHDDYYDEIVKEKIPVKYFDTEEKAKNYIENKVDKDYYYCELEVE